MRNHRKIRVGSTGAAAERSGIWGRWLSTRGGHAILSGECRPPGGGRGWVSSSGDPAREATTWPSPSSGATAPWSAVRPSSPPPSPWRSLATTKPAPSKSWSPPGGRHCPRPRSSSSTTTRPTAPAPSPGASASASLRCATQGKGHAVRAIFEDLADRDVVILVDGDGTYPAEEARALIGPILRGEAHMTVGARRPVDIPGAMTPVRGLGNFPDHRRVSPADRAGRPATSSRDIAGSAATSSKRSTPAPPASRSRPRSPGRPSPAASRPSRFPSSTGPESPEPPRSSAHSATAGGSWPRSSAKASAGSLGDRSACSEDLRRPPPLRSGSPPSRFPPGRSSRRRPASPAWRSQASPPPR